MVSPAQQIVDDWTLFLRRSARLGYRDAQSPSFDSLCETANEQLFLKIIKNKQHLLHSLLPPQREQHYKLRDRVHKLLSTACSDIFGYR